MFVKQLDLKEFRGIKTCDRPLQFADFTVLIGRNNSGKSSILEALSLLPLPSDFIVNYTNDTRFNLLSKLHGGISSMVYAYSGVSSVNCFVNDRAWALRLNEYGRVNLSIEGIEQTIIDSKPVEAAAIALGITRATPDLPEKVNRSVFFIPDDTVFMNDLFNRLGDPKNRNLVTKLGAHATVATELINKCVDDKYTELLFAPELSARKELPNGKPLYIKMKDLGDGVKKAALIALWFEALSPSLVLWDDFEGSAHPTLIRVLLEWLSKKKCQTILSTHSIDVLTSLVDVKPKNAKVIQLKKTPEDVLLQKDLNLNDLEGLLTANQDPRKLVDLLGL